MKPETEQDMEGSSSRMLEKHYRLWQHAVRVVRFYLVTGERIEQIIRVNITIYLICRC